MNFFFIFFVHVQKKSSCTEKKFMYRKKVHFQTKSSFPDIKFFSNNFFFFSLRARGHEFKDNFEIHSNTKATLGWMLENCCSGFVERSQRWSRVFHPLGGCFHLSLRAFWSVFLSKVTTGWFEPKAIIILLISFFCFSHGFVRQARLKTFRSHLQAKSLFRLQLCQQWFLMFHEF